MKEIFGICQHPSVKNNDFECSNICPTCDYYLQCSKEEYDKTDGQIKVNYQ